ncbi:MAG TPA: TRAP transporter small permease subunit [Burkholderiales bacterium]|nr:TRAP transporter small permease subunit [Burkholderiales bacterium]
MAAVKESVPHAAPPTAQAHDHAPFALRLSERLRVFVDFVGRKGSWLMLPMVLITIVDVVGRKISWLDDAGRLHGMQVFLVSVFGRIFESTMLQELEWHFHAALFALVLGYGYIHNAHVRVDLIRENLAFRRKAWLELFGITFFLIPFTCTILYFAMSYAYGAFVMGEQSTSTVGLTHRWIIKSVLVFGLATVVTAGIAVWLQIALVLFGDPSRRFQLMTMEWPEEDSRIEGKERVKLDEAPDTLVAPDEALRERTSKILTGG